MQKPTSCIIDIISNSQRFLFQRRKDTMSSQMYTIHPWTLHLPCLLGLLIVEVSEHQDQDEITSFQYIHLPQQHPQLDDTTKEGNTFQISHFDWDSPPPKEPLRCFSAAKISNIYLIAKFYERKNIFLSKKSFISYFSIMKCFEKIQKKYRNSSAFE